MTDAPHPALDPQALAERYVAVWNEPDPDARRRGVRTVWADGGGQLLEAPEDMRKAARAIGFGTAVLEARGHPALDTRVATAYDEFVAANGFTFRARPGAARLGDVLTFHWEMVPAGGGEPAALGLEVFLLDAEDRIVDDYQFVLA